MNSFQYPVQSVGTVNFLEGLAQYAATAMNNIGGVPPIFSRRYFIRAISVITIDNFGPQFNFFSSAAGNTSAVATNTFLSRWGFTGSMGQQIAATGLYQYYVDGLAIPYRDDDAINSVTPPSLHVILENLSATAKVAAAPGAMTATFWLEPMTAGL